MRKEQGRKLKEILMKKRQDKTKQMQEELADLLTVAKARQLKSEGYKEELDNRGFKSVDEFDKRLAQLQLKLGLKEDDTANPNKEKDKYKLHDIDDQFLTPEQVKQKRIQKMQKTAA